jgi:hypothetical protein
MLSIESVDFCVCCFQAPNLPWYTGLGMLSERWEALLYNVRVLKARMVDESLKCISYFVVVNIYAM